MRKSLISSENSVIRNALGVAAMSVLLPVGLIATLVAAPFSRPAKRSAAEVAKFLRDFIDGTGGDWDWDDFSSIAIADPRLEAIRLRAIEVESDSEDQRKATLEQLHQEAMALATEK